MEKGTARTDFTAAQFIKANNTKPGIFFPGCTVLFSFDTLMGLVKARYGNLPEAMREHPALQTIPQLLDFMEDIWENVKPAEFVDGLRIEDVNAKRIYFQWIGPARLFNGVEKKTKVDTFINKRGIKFSEELNSPHPELGNTYHLWLMDAGEMGLQSGVTLAAVQCWCPSTGTEYWLMVDSREPFCQRGKYSAKDAMASLQPCWIDNPAYAIRQGEVVTFFPKQGEKAEIRDTPKYMKGDEFFQYLTYQT